MLKCAPRRRRVSSQTQALNTLSLPKNLPKSIVKTKHRSDIFLSSPINMSSQSSAPGMAPQAPISGQTVAQTQASAQTLTTGSPALRGPSTSEPLNESVRAKFVSTLGYVVPAPSFPYSVISDSRSGPGFSQQCQSAPVVKNNPPASAAALQPPVPGQSSVAGTGHTQGGKFALNTTACLKPPAPGQSVPGRPNQFVPGSIPQNVPAPMQSPIAVPKGHPSIAAGFSFSGTSQLPSAAESLQKNQSSNPNSSTATLHEAGSASAVSSNSQSTSLPVHASASPLVSAPASLYPMTMWMQTTPLPGPPGMPVPPGTPGPPSMASPSLSSTPNARPMAVDPSASLRPIPPASGQPNAAPAPGRPQLYDPYHSLPAMGQPPQGHWLQPPQVSGVQRPGYMPYPSGVPAPFPLPVRGMSPPVLPDSQPPGVYPVVPPGGTSAGTVRTGQSASNVGAQSPPPGIVHGKQSDAISSMNGDTTKNENLDFWTAHKTETGAVYYYNSLTGESTYERPSSFEGEVEKVPVQSTPVSTEKLAGTDCVLVTTNDGKKFYHNTKTKVSSWQVPAEVAELRKKQDVDSVKLNTSFSQSVSMSLDKGPTPTSLSIPAITAGGREATPLRTSGAPASSSALDLVKKKLQDAGAPVTSSPNPASSAPNVSDLNGLGPADAVAKGQQSENSKDKPKDGNGNGDGNVSDSSSDSDVDSGPTKKECVIQFKEMLKERGVAPFSKWEKELPKILFDPRFKAVPGYTTRRALFEHYVRTRAEEERKEKRAAQKAAIVGFKQLLEEASEDIDHKTDYQTFKRKWGCDPRFESLDRKDREILLNERVLPLKKAAEEKIQEERAAAVSSFKSMLRDSGEINTSTRWSRVKDSLRNDPRYKSVRHEERESLFNEYTSELKAAEEEAERAVKAKRDEQEKLKEREREMRKRKEREEQDMERVRLKVRRKEAVTSYQALLVETIKDPKASWTESRPKLEKDPQERAMNPDLDKADTEKLFREHIRTLYERCAREFRALLAEVITAEIASHVTDDGKTVLTSWSEAKRLLKPDPRYSKMPRKDRETLWCRFAEEMQRRQKSSDSKEQKSYAESKSKVPVDSERSPQPPRRTHGRR